MKLLFFYVFGILAIISGIFDLKTNWKSETKILKHFAIGQIFCGVAVLLGTIMMTLGYE